jgi:hypothetical protein
MTLPLSPDVLRGTTSLMLEEAAFLFCEPMEEPMAWPDRLIEARISFSGPRRGVMRLRVTEAFGIELAANLLGIEPGDEDAGVQARAAVAEMLNIVCGALVAEWFGTGQVCQLGIPEIAEIASGAGAANPHCAVALIADERHRLEVEVTVEEGAS